MRVAAVLLLLATLPSAAAPAGKDDFDDFTRSLMRSRVSSNPRLVLEYCEEAQAKAARFDRNDVWQGLVMDCLGHAAPIRGNKAAACEYLARAVESFRKARPRPHEISWAKDGAGRAKRYGASLGC